MAAKGVTERGGSCPHVHVVVQTVEQTSLGTDGAPEKARVCVRVRKQVRQHPVVRSPGCLLEDPSGWCVFR